MDHIIDTDDSDAEAGDEGAQSSDPVPPPLPAGALAAGEVPSFDLSANVSPVTSSDIRGGAPAAGDGIRLGDVHQQDKWLWLWPPAIVLTVAVCGAAWGPYGGLLAGIVTASTLALLVGGDVFSSKVRLAVLLAATAATTVATVGHTW